MTIKKINVDKISENIEAVIKLGDVDQLHVMRDDLTDLRRLAFGTRAAGARPALYDLVGKITVAIRTLCDKAADDRVGVLTERIDDQLHAAEEKLEDLSKDPRARLDSVRAHLRVAWEARQQLGGPNADPDLRLALGRLCKSEGGKDGRSKFFSDLEKEFGEMDGKCAALIEEADRLHGIERATARTLPKGNSFLRVGRGVVLC